MEIQCPACSQRLRVPDEAIDKSARCRTCGHVFPVSEALERLSELEAVEPNDVDDHDEYEDRRFESDRFSTTGNRDTGNDRAPAPVFADREAVTPRRETEPASKNGSSYGWIIIIAMILLFRVGPKVVKLFMNPQPPAPVVREIPVPHDIDADEIQRQRDLERLRVIEEAERRRKQ